MVDKCSSLFAPRRMILEHLSQKVSGRIEPQAPTVVSYPLVHTSFSNLCPLLFSPPHSATSSELPGVIPQEVVVCASLPWILLLSESMLRSSILLIQSTHVSRLLLTGLLHNLDECCIISLSQNCSCLYVLYLLQSKSIFPLPEISLPFL